MATSSTTSGHALFDRRCRLTIASPVSSKTDFNSTRVQLIEIDGGGADNAQTPTQRMSFNITKTLDKEPNNCEIVVTNLSPTTRQSLQQKGTKVRLEAGYKSIGMQTLFQGDARTADPVRNGPDWDTTIRLGDGERAWRYARVSQSWSPGTPVSNVLKTLAQAMGIGNGNVNAKAAAIGAVLDQGWMAVGSAARAFDKLIVSLGKTWSIQDGDLQILDPYETLSTPIPDITPTTGLIGSPEMGSPSTKGKPAYLQFKCLLTVVKPGGKVKLTSERYNGYIRVHKIVYTGDTHGGDWYSTIYGTVLKQ